MGPIAVARGSVRMLQASLGGLVVLAALLAVGALRPLSSRLGRARAELLEKQGMTREGASDDAASRCANVSKIVPHVRRAERRAARRDARGPARAASTASSARARRARACS